MSEKVKPLKIWNNTTKTYRYRIQKDKHEIEDYEFLKAEVVKKPCI